MITNSRKLESRNSKVRNTSEFISTTIVISTGHTYMTFNNIICSSSRGVPAPSWYTDFWLLSNFLRNSSDSTLDLRRSHICKVKASDLNFRAASEHMNYVKNSVSPCHSRKRFLLSATRLFTPHSRQEIGNIVGVLAYCRHYFPKLTSYCTSSIWDIGTKMFIYIFWRSIYATYHT